MESVSSEYQEHLQPSKILRPKLPINWSCDQKHTRPEKNPKLKKKRTKPNPSPTLICTTCLHLFLNFLSQITLYRRPICSGGKVSLPSSWILIGCVVGGWKKIMVVIVDHLMGQFWPIGHFWPHGSFLTGNIIMCITCLSDKTGPAPSKSCMFTYLTSRLIT